MGDYTNRIVPRIDFSPVAELPVNAVLDICLRRIRTLVAPLQQFFPEPMLPEPGGSDGEIAALERELDFSLPSDYRAFLRRARWAVLDDGVQVWGLDLNGASYGESLWISDQHHQSHRFLVFGYYWAYADGDQLLIPVDDPDHPVVLYLHEHGPLFEYFAPSFSLALWRLVQEGPSA